MLILLGLNHLGRNHWYRKNKLHRLKRCYFIEIILLYPGMCLSSDCLYIVCTFACIFRRLFQNGINLDEDFLKFAFGFFEETTS